MGFLRGGGKGIEDMMDSFVDELMRTNVCVKEQEEVDSQRHAFTFEYEV